MNEEEVDIETAFGFSQRHEETTPSNSAANKCKNESSHRQKRKLRKTVPIVVITWIFNREIQMKW